MAWLSSCELFALLAQGSPLVDVGDALAFARYSEADLRDGFLDIHPRTLARWRAGTTPLPLVALRALQYRAGDLSGIVGGAWSRWSISGDTLYAPDGTAYPMGEIRKMYALKLELYRLEQEVAALRAQLTAGTENVEFSEKIRPFPTSPGRGR